MIYFLFLLYTIITIVYEMTKMFEIIYPSGGGAQIIANLKNDIDFNGQLDASDFIRWTQKGPSTLAPLLRYVIRLVNIASVLYYVFIFSNVEVL